VLMESANHAEAARTGTAIAARFPADRAVQRRVAGLLAQCVALAEKEKSAKQRRDLARA
jgi:hypothetical protein